MPIKRPGVKFRSHKLLSKKGGGKREIAALLSLTAMVDMFTVLVVFLLQNYDTSNLVIYHPDGVSLPQAEATKEMTPSHVVSISAKSLHVDDLEIIGAAEIQSQEDWMIRDLYYALKDKIELAKKEQDENLRTVIRQAVAVDEPEEVDENWRKVTIQADEDVDFLTVKKIMFTVTEAGAGEINFAVRKSPKEVPN